MSPHYVARQHPPYYTITVLSETWHPFHKICLTPIVNTYCDVLHDLIQSLLRHSDQHAPNTRGSFLHNAALWKWEHVLNAIIHWVETAGLKQLIRCIYITWMGLKCSLFNSACHYNCALSSKVTIGTSRPLLNRSFVTETNGIMTLLVVARGKRKASQLLSAVHVHDIKEL